MSYPSPPYGNRLPSDQNVRPASATRGARLPSPRGRGRARSQSITPEPYNANTRTNQSECRQESVGEAARDQDCSIRQSGGELKALCDFCGNNIEEAVFCHVNNAVYHTDCINVHIPSCERAIGAFRKLVKSKVPILRVGINVSFLYGQKKQDKTNKKKRAFKSVELLNNASALLNSGSGYIFIHLVGLAPGDNFIGAFDEFADVKLNGLINDGSAFDDIFKKQRLSEHPNPELKKFTDILVLFVDAADFLVTSDPKTKSALDDCIIDTTDLSLVKFLKKKRQFEHQYHKLPIDSPDDLTRLHESRKIQLKACFEPAERVDKLVTSLFDDLKLAQYISAFSKLETGGSYLFGLAEEIYESQGGYKSKRVFVKAPRINNTVQFENLVEECTRQTVLVCDYTGSQLDNNDLIHINCIPSTDKQQSLTNTDDYVIHISVRSVSGIVFYEKDGPVAFRVDRESNCITRLSVAEWFEHIRQRINDSQ